MKRTTQLVTFAAMTTLIAGAATAGKTGAQSAELQTEHRETAPFMKHSWERGHILGLVEEREASGHGDAQPVHEQPWERGQLLNLLKEKGGGHPDAALAPPVVIYFDKTASEPGLPAELGNTQASRSIMLKYLEQARRNAAS